MSSNVNNLENVSVPVKPVTKRAPERPEIKAAIDEIRKTWGQGSIMRFDDVSQGNIEVVSTGSIDIDTALGIGGLPMGRIIEIYGNEGSGKTTIALQVIANAQKKGGICAFIDAEHALDIKYAETLGVNVQELLISQPDYGEQALEITDTLIRSGGMSVIVVDSVAALVTKAELEGNMGDAVMGAQARLMSQALRKLTGSVSKYKTIVIFINQIRSKIGIMFGSPDTTTGGKALKFYSSVRLEVSMSKGEDGHGKGKVKVQKNKLFPPYKTAEYDFVYGKGINNDPSIVKYAAIHKILQKNGNWYAYNGENIGNGTDSTVQYLNANPKVFDEIKTKLNKAIKESITTN